MGHVCQSVEVRYKFPLCAAYFSTVKYSNVRIQQMSPESQTHISHSNQKSIRSQGNLVGHSMNLTSAKIPTARCRQFEKIPDYYCNTSVLTEYHHQTVLIMRTVTQVWSSLRTAISWFEPSSIDVDNRCLELSWLCCVYADRRASHTKPGY
jgi:hypothetical protein